MILYAKSVFLVVNASFRCLIILALWPILCKLYNTYMQLVDEEKCRPLFKEKRTQHQQVSSRGSRRAFPV